VVSCLSANPPILVPLLISVDDPHSAPFSKQIKYSKSVFPVKRSEQYISTPVRSAAKTLKRQTLTFEASRTINTMSEDLETAIT